MNKLSARQLIAQLDDSPTDVLVTIQWLIAEKLFERLVPQDGEEQIN